MSTADQPGQGPPWQAAPGSAYPITFLLGVLHLQQALVSWQATQAQVKCSIPRVAQHVTCDLYKRGTGACALLLMPLQSAVRLAWLCSLLCSVFVQLAASADCTVMPAGICLSSAGCCCRTGAATICAKAAVAVHLVSCHSSFGDNTRFILQSCGHRGIAGVTAGKTASLCLATQL